jgi:hypothetical protein
MEQNAGAAWCDSALDSPEQYAHVLALSDQHPRSRAYRARRAAGGLRQLSLVVNA